MSIAETNAVTADTPRETLNMGPVVSAIAYDIDVALTPITLYTDALLERESLSERARNYLTNIRRAADDVARTAGRLRELDRVHDPETRATDTGRFASPASARSLRVLLIDDDPTLIESLRSALADEGHKVTTANGGQVGIEKIRAARGSGMLFDVVITDLAMPDVDGREVISNLRAISPQTPIVLLTGWRHQLAEGLERALKVDRLLGKPPRIRELRAALTELTARRATDRLG